MREERSEVSLDRGEPIEDACRFFFREPDEASLVQDERHVMQKVFLLRLEIPLIKIIERKEIFEGNILEVRIHSTVEADAREAYRIDREITEPFKVRNGLSDLQCGDREDLLSPSYDKQCAFLPYHVQASPSHETSSFHLRKREAAIEQAEHEA